MRDVFDVFSHFSCDVFCVDLFSEILRCSVITFKCLNNYDVFNV
jgi:hypothetical protein